MEMHGNFDPHLQQKWVVREYYSHGLEYYLYSYKGSIPQGAKWVTLGSIARNYIGHLDPHLLIIYRAKPEE